MNTIEKNDVDITPLFGWKQEFEILDDANGDTYAKVWMRVLGDADLNRARVYALRRSADLRKKLKSADSDERVIYVVEKEALNKDQMVMLLLSFSMRDVMREAMKAVTVKKPVIPASDASLEAQEKYQKDVDDYPDKKRKELQKYAEKEVKKLKKEFEKMNEDELYSKYISGTIDEMCNAEMIKAFREASTYYGTYTDESCKTRLFSSMDEFLNLRTEIKDSFITSYTTLEFGMDELKKLRVATP